MNIPYLRAQCEVDAGEDIYTCIDAITGTIDTMQLNAIILEGESPFTYKWEANYHTGLISLPVITASHFLNDTTLLNPLLVESILSNNNPLTFTLTVTDNNGSQCIDSTNIVFSHFGALPDFLEREISLGDSIEIYSIIGLGIPPLSYAWTPNYNISDTTISNPYVWPDIDMMYDVVVTDSIGCVNKFTGTKWTIFVNPVSTEDIYQNKSVKIYPNPIDATTIIEIDDQNINQNIGIEIYNNQGKPIFKDVIPSMKNYLIGNKIQENGIYYYILRDNSGRIIATDKLIKER